MGEATRASSMRFTFSRSPLLIAGATASLLAIGLAGTGVLLAAGAFIPAAPPPTPPPSRPPSGSATSAPGPPTPVHPDFLVTAHTLADRVLHWSQTTYNYFNLGADPANAQPVTGDIWERVGADANAVELHGHYTLADGSFYQETLETGTRRTIVLGSRFDVPSAAHCAPATAVISGRLQIALPPFADQTRLGGAGYQRNGGLTRPLPSTAPLNGTASLASFGPENLAQGWVRSESRDGMTNTYRLELGPQGRVLSSGARLNDPSGKRVTENWVAYGALVVYAPSSVPSSVFALSEQAQEICHG